jgi:hypothetical protein
MVLGAALYALLTFVLKIDDGPPAATADSARGRAAVATGR